VAPDAQADSSTNAEAEKPKGQERGSLSRRQSDYDKEAPSRRYGSPPGLELEHARLDAEGSPTDAGYPTSPHARAVAGTHAGSLALTDTNLSAFDQVRPREAGAAAADGLSARVVALSSDARAASPVLADDGAGSYSEAESIEASQAEPEWAEPRTPGLGLPSFFGAISDPEQEARAKAIELERLRARHTNADESSSAPHAGGKAAPDVQRPPGLGGAACVRPACNVVGDGAGPGCCAGAGAMSGSVGGSVGGDSLEAKLSWVRRFASTSDALVDGCAPSTERHSARNVGVIGTAAARPPDNWEPLCCDDAFFEGIPGLRDLPDMSPLFKPQGPARAPPAAVLASPQTLAGLPASAAATNSHTPPLSQSNFGNSLGLFGSGLFCPAAHEVQAASAMPTALPSLQTAARAEMWAEYGAPAGSSACAPVASNASELLQSAFAINPFGFDVDQRQKP